MEIELLPKELYSEAIFHFENEQYDNLLETCSLLLNNFPDSTEAKLVVKNLPIMWDRDFKQVSLKDLKPSEMNEIKGLTGGKIAAFLTGVIAMISLYGFFSKDLDPIQASWFFGFLGGATVTLYLSSKRCAIGWIMGIIMWVVGSFVGIFVGLIFLLPVFIFLDNPKEVPILTAVIILSVILFIGIVFKILKKT